MSILQKLTEGVVSRDMRKEGAALSISGSRPVSRRSWNGREKNNMARLLENQANNFLKRLLRNAKRRRRRFRAVAFPIIHRVFGGLIANDLVSVQPMSLPSGLIFFMDFKFGGTDGATSRLDFSTIDRYMVAVALVKKLPVVLTSIASKEQLVVSSTT